MKIDKFAETEKIEVLIKKDYGDWNKMHGESSDFCLTYPRY